MSGRTSYSGRSRPGPARSTARCPRSRRSSPSRSPGPGPATAARHPGFPDLLAEEMITGTGRPVPAPAHDTQFMTLKGGETRELISRQPARPGTAMRHAGASRAAVPGAAGAGIAASRMAHGTAAALLSRSNDIATVSRPRAHLVHGRTRPAPAAGHVPRACAPPPDHGGRALGRVDLPARAPPGRLPRTDSPPVPLEKEFGWDAARWCNPICA
jgi:hypothetical protein